MGHRRTPKWSLVNFIKRIKITFAFKWNKYTGQSTVEADKLKVITHFCFGDIKLNSEMYMLTEAKTRSGVIQD